jgi:predicted PurR-regulated permease PerM
VICYALDPLVRAATRIVPRIIASALVVGLLTGAIGFTAYSFSDDAADLAAELPDAVTKMRAELRRSRQEPNALSHVQEAAKELQRTADEAAGANPAPQGVQRVQIEEPTFNFREYLSWGSASVVTLAGQVTLIIFFVFFLLASGDMFKRKLVKIAGPSLEQKKSTVRMLDEINRQIERFLVIRVVTSAVVALATWGAFELVGLQQAALWGLAAGILNSIPYLGPAIVAAATFVVGFVQFGTLAMGVYVAGISLVITTVEGWMLTPWLTSRASRTNEVAVFVGLIYWTFVWGIWGALLAVPMLVAFKAICDHTEQLKPVGELLGE